FYIAGEIDDNTTTTFSINVSDAQLQQQTDVTNYYTYKYDGGSGDNALPNCAMGLVYHQRLIMIGDASNPTLAYPPELGFPQQFRADVGFQDISNKNSFRISNLFLMRDVEYLVTTLGIVAIEDNGGDPSTWQQAPISNDVGTVSYDGVSNESDEDFVIIEDF